MDGSISTGNNYQTGAEQLKLTANRKPEEDIYLAGYIGGEYTGNNWTVTDDYTICDEWDAANPDAASYNSYLIHQMHLIIFIILIILLLRVEMQH